MLVLPWLLLSAAMLSEPAAWTTAQAAPIIDPRVRESAAHGNVRVLVELRTSHIRPESELSTAEAVDRQRAAIAQAQQSVLARLAGHFRLIRSYTVIPWLLIEVDAGALAVLEEMGDVISRVLPDDVRTPSRPGAN
jgi:hypothetical protein